MKKRSDNLPEDAGFVGDEAGEVGLFTEDVPVPNAEDSDEPLFFLGDEETAFEKPESFVMPKKHRLKKRRPETPSKNEADAPAVSDPEAKENAENADILLEDNAGEKAEKPEEIKETEKTEGAENNEEIEETDITKEAESAEGLPDGPEEAEDAAEDAENDAAQNAFEAEASVEDTEKSEDPEETGSKPVEAIPALEEVFGKNKNENTHKNKDKKSKKSKNKTKGPEKDPGLEKESSESPEKGAVIENAEPENTEKPAEGAGTADPEDPEKKGKLGSEKNGKGEKKPARGTGAFDVVRYALLFVCFTVFLYCSYTLLSSVIERSHSRELYDDMRRIFYDDAGFEDSYLIPGVQNVTSVDLLSAFVGVQPPKQEIQIPTGSKLVDKVNYLKSINSDTVGWLTVDGTNIDYPVVHSADNDFYLRRDFYGRSNLAGTLFTDSRNSMKLMENRNTVIYGHNMNDGSMFNNLHDFKNESVFKNGRIQFVTANGIFIYEVFSVHEALETSEYFQTDFTGDAHFASYLADMQAQSLFKKEGITLSPADKVLTLSTCLDPIIQSEYRWAVHAKLVQVVNYTP